MCWYVLTRFRVVTFVYSLVTGAFMMRYNCYHERFTSGAGRKALWLHYPDAEPTYIDLESHSPSQRRIELPGFHCGSTDNGVAIFRNTDKSQIAFYSLDDGYGVTTSLPLELAACRLSGVHAHAGAFFLILSDKSTTTVCLVVLESAHVRTLSVQCVYVSVAVCMCARVAHHTIVSSAQ